MLYKRLNKPLLLLLASLSFELHASSYKDLSFNYGLVQKPSLDAFSVCSTHGCKTVHEIGLTKEQQRTLRTFFTPAAETPEQERKQIAAAISQMENWAGPLTDTFDDKAGNVFLFSGSKSRQMDCVDESTNTTTYLTLIEQQNLLRWHKVQSTAHRGYIIFGWPHNTAVVLDTRNNSKWAVDSWFQANGEKPEIVPLEQWKDGWEPPGF